jgi:SAM-dependent methyltransferase
MVSREEVFGCYRYILGREPESSDVVESRLATKSLTELRRAFIDSTEFMQGLRSSRLDIEACLPSQIWRANRVDCEASAPELEQLMDRIRREWEDFGKSEPHWSVLTHDKYKQDAISANFDEFYESGDFAAKIVAAFCERHGIDTDALNTCFELGCGVGRITIHLAKLFGNVIGADISKIHLEVCAEELARRSVKNVELVCLDSPLRLSDLRAIQCFCSFIVLQHNPPPVITFILDAVLSRLTRGGVAIFQVPTWRNGYSFDLNAYLRLPAPLHMEMHVLPQEQIFRILFRNRCRVVEIREDGWAEGRTTESISNTFFVVKD